MPVQDVEQTCTDILRSLQPAQGIEASASLSGILALLHNHETSELHDSIGQSVAGTLLQFFINPDEASCSVVSVRRWAGLVLSQLCLRSTSTATSLGAEHNASVDLQGLGRIILAQSENEDLKIVSGMIIKNLVSQGVDVGFCLPGDAPHDQFPAKDSGNWIRQFQDFLDKIAEGNPSLQSKTEIFFLGKVLGCEGTKFDDTQSRLVMLVQECLTIIIPPSATYHTRCIDIPFSHISHAALMMADDSQVYDMLGLELKDPSKSSLSASPPPYFLDARGCHSKEVYLCFAELEDAQVALNVIEKRRREAVSKDSVHTSRFSISQEALDVSQTPPPSQPDEIKPLLVQGSASAALHERRSAKFAGQRNTTRQNEISVTPLKASDGNARLKESALAPLLVTEKVTRVSNKDAKLRHQPATEDDEENLYGLNPTGATSWTKIPQKQPAANVENAPKPVVYPNDGIFLNAALEIETTSQQPAGGKTNASKSETTEAKRKLTTSLSSSRRTLLKNVVKSKQKPATECEPDDSTVFDLPDDSEDDTQSSRLVTKKGSKRKSATRSQEKGKTITRRPRKKAVVSSDPSDDDPEDGNYQLSQKTNSAPTRTTRTTRSTTKRESTSRPDKGRSKPQPTQQQKNSEDPDGPLADLQNDEVEMEPPAASVQSEIYANGNSTAQHNAGNSQEDAIYLNSDIEPESELSPSLEPELPPIKSSKAKSIVGTSATKEQDRMPLSDKRAMFPPIYQSQKDVRESVEVPVARKPSGPTTPTTSTSLNPDIKLLWSPTPVAREHVEESVETPPHNDHSIINTYISRKSTIINFGPHGPVNQGRLPRKGSVARTPHAPPSRGTYGSTKSQKQKSAFSELIDDDPDDTMGLVEALPVKTHSPKREPIRGNAQPDPTKVIADETGNRMPAENSDDALPFYEEPPPKETNPTKPPVLESQLKQISREATPRPAANGSNILRVAGTKSLEALIEHLNEIVDENPSSKKSQPKTTNHKKRAASLLSYSPPAKRRSQSPGLPVQESNPTLGVTVGQVSHLEKGSPSAPVTKPHQGLPEKVAQENQVLIFERPEHKHIDRRLDTSQKRVISRRHSITEVDRHGSPMPIDSYGSQESQILQRYEEQAAADNEQLDDQSGSGDDATLSSPNPLQPLKYRYAGSGPFTTPHIMSSNTKRLPGSPSAESTAISGHMPQRLLNKASMLAPIDEFGNPFIKQAQKDRNITPDTNFTRLIRERAEVRRVKFTEPEAEENKAKTPNKGLLWAETSKVPHTELDEDPDKTLVEEEDEVMSYAQMISNSSSPQLTSDTTISSEQQDDTLIAEMEWEASLMPHQQDMVTILTRLSRHLVRHIIDKETAIHDIVAEYERDATALVEGMEQKHKREHMEKRALVHGTGARVVQRFGEIEQRVGREMKEAGREFKGLEREWAERTREGEELLEGLRGVWKGFQEEA